MKTYDHIVHAIIAEPWAIIPEKLAAICEFINLKLSGANIPFEAAARPEDRRVQDVAVLPLFGMLAHRGNILTQTSGGTSLQKFGNELAALVNDPDIGAVVLDVDSPGGSVTGVQETGDLIAAAAKRKPIIAYANATAASAAYWLGSQASELWITPSGQVGSIGVLAAHEDTSGAKEKLGIKTTIVSAGKYKAEGQGPLTEDARDYMQARVDQYYDTFVKAVALGRHVSEKEVRGGFGQGRIVGAKEALEMGMVDGIGTFEHVIERLMRGDVGKRKMRAEAAPDPVLAEAQLRWAKEQYE